MQWPMVMPALGPSFGVAPLRHVQMHHTHIKEVPIAAVILEMSDHVTVGNFRRFTHHLSQTTGEFKAPVKGMNL